MNKGKFYILIFLATAFVLWYFIIYKSEIKKVNIPVTDPYSESQHIIWGYPVAEGVRIFEYEGYISGYDTVRLNPLWISYNLKKEFINGRKYLDKRKFAPDPELDKKHTAVDSDFRNSGFDRGHLARQSDMKGRSEKCEIQSLYFTNISPQKQNFNRKIWNNLEMSVDRLTEYFGQSWIVTGPYFDQDRQLIKNRVEIPDGFYKIVLLDTKSGMYPLAFVLAMDDTGTDIEKYAVSIDSVESLTGIDFFSELNDPEEDKLESVTLEVPYQWKK